MHEVPQGHGAVVTVVLDEGDWELIKEASSGPTAIFLEGKPVFFNLYYYNDRVLYRPSLEAAAKQIGLTYTRAK